MSLASTLDERLRSVEKVAIKATTESVSSDQGLLDANRSPAQIIEHMKAKFEREGVQIDALCATGKPGRIKIRSEITMSQLAAERLFGQSPVMQQRRNEEEISHTRNRMVHPMRRDGTRAQILRELVAQFDHRLRHFTPPDWMRAIIDLDREDKSDAALDELFDRIDAMLSAREFDNIDGILAAMPVEGPSLTLMMGLLSITRPAGEYLPSRARFFDRVYRLCKAMRRDAESLLGGLK